MKPFRLLSMAVCASLVCAVMLVSGCAQTNVRLLYNPVNPASVPSVTAPRVTVVLFEDRRGRADIGVRRDGTAFHAGSNVAEWVSYSLADELTRQGAQVSFATSMKQAKAGNPEYIVSGSVEHVWMTEKGIGSYNAAIRIQARLQSPKAATVTRNFSAQQEKSGIPGTNMPEQILSSTLGDVLGSTAQSLMPLMK